MIYNRNTPMKKITRDNYRKDEYYPRVMNAVTALLQKDRVIRPMDVFVQTGLLERKNLECWRAGKVPYLEQVINCNLSKTSRILRLLAIHAENCKLKPSMTYYKHKSMKLRFSKSGDPNIGILHYNLR